MARQGTSQSQPGTSRTAAAVELRRGRTVLLRLRPDRSEAVRLTPARGNAVWIGDRVLARVGREMRLARVEGCREDGGVRLAEVVGWILSENIFGKVVPGG